MSPLSLRPSSFVEGGGLIDDVDVTVQQATFVLWDYNGQVNPAVPALAMTLAQEDGSTIDQYFAAGDAKYFVPSKDDKTPAEDNMGPFLLQVGDKAGLNNNTNAAKFIISLVNAGFPEDKLEKGDISVLEGLKFHLKREAVKRTGLVRTGKNAGREQTVITCAKILSMPGESKPASTLGKPKANGAAAASNGGGGHEEEATSVLLEVLSEADGTLPKAKLSTMAFQKLKGNPNQKEISKLLFADTFIKSVDGIKLEGGIVSIA